MKFNSKELTITGRTGEVIRLKVEAVGTVHKVTYNLAENSRILRENQDIKFIFEPSAGKTNLTMDFHYTAPNAESFYKIEIAGQSGESATYLVKQPAGATDKQLSFSLEGDPDTDFPTKTKG